MTESIRTAFEAICDEMRRIGLWDIEPPASASPPGAFGGDAMAFEQWLRFVFVPRVESLLTSDGPWPRESHVAARAYREWKMHGDVPEVDRLLDHLRAFDALFG